MAENPIHYSDLIGEDVRTGLDSLIQQVGEVQSSLLEMMGEVKKEAKSLGLALAQTTSASKEDRDMTAEYASKIEKLQEANDDLSKSLKKVTEDLDALKKKKKEDHNDTLSLSDSYKTLSGLIEETGVNLEQLLTQEKQQKIAQKNGEVANNALADSYNKLYAQYNLVKNVLNAMGGEMRENTEIGKKWEAQAASMMRTMKAMQEATGKHTLSVGDYGKGLREYEKELNGLSISTQQVLREMPTLANSLQQFFIAISNNVPIFVDNLKALQKASGSWSIAIKGVLTSIFSWQTALLGLLTILPKIAKALHDKKKAQEEEAKAQEKATKEAKKAVATYRTLADIYSDIRKASAGSVTEIKTLTAIINDNNRSLEQRIDAGTRLKQMFDEELGMYTAEDIALGKAQTKLQNITSLIYEQAKARKTLAEITKLTEELIALEDRAKLYEDFKSGSKTIKQWADAVLDAEKKGKKVRLGAREKEYVNTYLGLVSEMTGIKNRINALTAEIQPKFLIDDEDARNTVKNGETIKDYYWEWRKSVARILIDEQKRELELNDIEYEQKISNIRAEINERKKAGTLKKKEAKYMNDIIANLETERAQRATQIIWKYYDSTFKAISEEWGTLVEEESFEGDDLSISSKYDRLLAENADKLLASRKSLNEALESEDYVAAKKEGDNFKKLTKEKLTIEAEYQKALLKMRLDSGEISDDEYKKAIAEIENTLAKSISGLSSRRRGQFSIWNLLFGKPTEDGKGNVYRELSAEAQAFTNELDKALSTSIQYMNDWISTRMEMAETAIQAAQAESEATKSALERELEARTNGYANNVALARKEYEEKLREEKKAIAEKQRLAQVQENINTATQASSLITATTELWSSHASLGPIGMGLALAAIATMWGSFTAAKIQASQMTATKYGDGMSEYLDYGGSHASGNDIDFGRDKNGRQRRVERGEVIGVINKRNVTKYGVGKVTDIIDSLNHGTFDNKYGRQTEAIKQMAMRESILRSIGLNQSSLVDSLSGATFGEKYSFAFGGSETTRTDLSNVERGIKELVTQGETRVVSTPYGRIEYRGNNKRIIRNS